MSMTARKKTRKRRLELGNGVLLDSKGGLICHTINKSCSTCRWLGSFSRICFNGLSDRRANFTDSEDVCKEWEKRENEL